MERTSRRGCAAGRLARPLVAAAVALIVLAVALAGPSGAHFVGLVYYPPTPGGDGALYVSGSDGILYALDADGAPRWTHDAGAELTGPAAVAGDRILVGTATGRVVAVRPDGREAWAARLGDTGASTAVRALALDDGTVYVAAGTAVYGLGVADGARRFRVALDARPRGAPVVGERGVYVAAGDGASDRIVAIAPDGARRWSRAADGRITAIGPGPGDGLLVGVGEALLSLDPDGEERFRLRVGEVWRPPAVAGGRIAAGTLDGRLVVIQDGRVEHEVSLGEPAAPAFGPDGERVFAVTPEAVHAVEGGESRWRTRIGATVVTAPTVDADHVYVGTQLNRTYALGHDGAIAWIDRYETGVGDHGDATAPAFLRDAAGTPTRVVPPSIRASRSIDPPGSLDPAGSPTGGSGAAVDPAISTAIPVVIAVFGLIVLVLALGRRERGRSR